MYLALKILILLLLLTCGFSGFAQNTNPDYNKALADSLGSDDNGMKRYVLVILKTGSFSPTDKKVSDSLLRGHMANIEALAAVGKLVVAGPLVKNEKAYRGIFILNAPSVEEAKLMVAKDPAVAAGVFDIEYYQWYGSAALPMYLPYHDKLRKKK